VGAGSVVLRDVPPNSTVVGVPAHIIYRNGQRVLITDPHKIKDPLSDALIALAERLEKLERQDARAGAAQSATPPGRHSFADEDQEREAYRQELDRLRDYVSMGEGI
jgi:serine O-acetyltransferase